MAVTEIRPFKRAKRGVTSDLCDFFSFPFVAAGDCSAAQPFWSAVRSFLEQYGRLRYPPSLFPSLVTWQILLRVGDQSDGAGVVSLDVVEEDVARSRSVYCDQCRVVGWSGHPVCRKRYHFIIRDNSNPIEASGRACMECGHVNYLSDTRCKLCNSVFTADNLEDWVHRQFEDTTHLLHGVVHSNGYGHLLRINGREGGSSILSGSDIMNFWDRLCKRLAVRKVSVMDVSKKYGTEYRLVNAVAKGHAWYGRWGYQFGSGSYALTADAYKNAIHTISGVTLSTFYFQDRGPRTQLQSLIALYQSLSETELITLRDLFSFMLNLISELNREKLGRLNATHNHSSLLCPWTRDDVDRVEQSMVKVLITSGKWVSRRTLKGALYKAASPELVDYSLKYLGGRVAGEGMVVRVRCNPQSNDVEYKVEPRNSLKICTGVDGLEPTRPTKEQVIDDLRYLYNSVLNPDTMVMYRPESTRELVFDSAEKLLDCKQFIKDYMVEQVEVKNPFAIHLWCHVELGDNSRVHNPSVPPELIVLPRNATIADLKSEATKAFKEVYVVFKRFCILELPDLGRIEGNMTLNFLFGSCGSVRIRGHCDAKYGLGRFWAERGLETWIVDCICGTKDDDGERMLACDKCSIWQHTRCVGINSAEDIPENFLCEGCLDSCAESKCSNESSSPREQNAGHGGEGEGECHDEGGESRIKEHDMETILPSTKTCRDEIRTKGLGLGPRICV